MSRASAPGWQPFWLGDVTRRCYAALHPARNADTGIGLLIAAPLLHEQARSRRLVMEMANRFAELGVTCLRFDFYGSGDSDGSGAEMEFASMRRDLELASARLRAEPGVEHLAILAFRGAALAVDGWLGADGDIGHVLLWEPIVDGAAWLDELEHDDARELASSDRYPLGRGVPVASDDGQLMGLDVGHRLRRDLEGAQVSAIGWPAVTAVVRAGTLLPSSIPGTRIELAADAPLLGGDTRMAGGLFLTPALRSIVDRVAASLVQPLPQHAARPGRVLS